MCTKRGTHGLDLGAWSVSTDSLDPRSASRPGRQYISRNSLRDEWCESGWGNAQIIRFLPSVLFRMDVCRTWRLKTSLACSCKVGSPRRSRFFFALVRTRSKDIFGLGTSRRPFVSFASCTCSLCSGYSRTKDLVALPASTTEQQARPRRSEISAAR
jgi:hypothetical protein